MSVDPVTSYAERVRSGDIPAGKLCKLACQRHLDDLEKAKKGWLYYFDADTARQHIGLFQAFPMTKGKREWIGKGLVLEPWEEFIVGALFGWKRVSDDFRRFRMAYISVARKNGKSTLAAGIGNMLAFFDGEASAEVYAAATKRDQAKIVWGEAQRMVQRSPELRSYIEPLQTTLRTSDGSKFDPLGFSEDSTDGLNVHGAIIDELHAHKNRGMWDVLETATGARDQPLIFVITYAGYDKESVCWEQHSHAISVLNGTPDDSFFAYIAAADEGDDWRDPATWRKSNPNLGVSVSEEYLLSKRDRAIQVPGLQNSFRRRHNNEWTEQDVRWLDMATWDACGEVTFDPAELENQPTWYGLDLASKTDITALVGVTPYRDGFAVRPWFWIPEDNMHQRVLRDRVPYDVWEQQGFIETTPGNVFDDRYVELRILELARGDFQEMAYDEWNADPVINRLRDNIGPVWRDGQMRERIMPMRQGYASMNAPCKKLEALVLGKRLYHNNNPVLRWMASNVVVIPDPADNIKMNKAKSSEKIDGMVALAMAIGRAMLWNGEGGSIYDTQRVEFI